MNNFFLTILIITNLLSCNKRIVTDYKDFKISLNKCIANYYSSNDMKYLIQGYEILKNNEDFNENGITIINKDVAVPILLNLKKYNELEKLLNNNTDINKYTLSNTLNVVRCLKLSKSDKNKANFYINESIKMIQDSIKKAPQDSLLYADYFSMRMYLVGKENTLKEIDSMKLNYRKYSDLFYDNILKESIEEYPDDLLPKK